MPALLSTGSHIVEKIREMARLLPDHAALIQFGGGEIAQEVSYGELMGRVDLAAQSLEAQGLNAYDRCGVKGANSVNFIVQALAVLDRRLCLVPIADDYDTLALEAFMDRCKLHAMVECFTGGAGHGVRVEKLNPRGVVDGQNDEMFRELEPSFIRFTSGTTNERKGVVIGRQAVLARVEAANRGLGVGTEDRILWLLPMAHHFLVSILLYLRYGATILLPEGTAADQVLPCLRGSGVSMVYASPDHYQKLVEAGKRGVGAFPESLRLALSTSKGLSESLVKEFFNTFGIHLTQALGIIEVGLPVINLKNARSKPLALGQVQDDYRVTLKICEEDEISRIERDSGVGEVCIHGPGLFDAYLSPWIPADRVISQEGFRTGDLGYFDEEGDLYLLGRRKNRIAIGGRKFFCEEVEAVINAFPGIRESRVRSERIRGELSVVADVVMEGQVGLDAQKLMVFCLSRINRYKVPVAYHEQEVLEKTPTGKIRRW